MTAGTTALLQPQLERAPRPGELDEEIANRINDRRVEHLSDSRPVRTK
jgi:hypothetical protein